MQEHVDAYFCIDFIPEEWSMLLPLSKWGPHPLVLSRGTSVKLIKAF